MHTEGMETECFIRPSFRTPGVDGGKGLQPLPAEPGVADVSREILLTAERLLRHAAADVAYLNPCEARAYIAAARNLYSLAEGAHR